MSASKKKKKFKKVRIEETNNVLSEKEIEEKQKAILGIKEDETSTDDSFEDTMEIPVVEISEAIQRLIDSSEQLINDENNNASENTTQKIIEDAETRVNPEEEKIDDTKTDKIEKVIKEYTTANNDEETETVQSVGKELIKVETEDEEKPEYVKEMLEKSRRRMQIFISTVGVFLIVILFSTVFAIMDSGSTTIAKGVKIKNIDVSKLSIGEAKTKIEDITQRELGPEIKIKYENEFESSFKAEQIEFEYDIDKAVEEAYQVGKNKNIVENNYSILFSALFGKNIKLENKYNEDLLNTFVDEVNANIPGVVIEPAYYREEDELVVSKGIDGLTVDKESLKKQLIEDLTGRNILEMKDDSYSQIINLEVFDTKAEPINIAKIYEEIHTEPKDAYYELEPYALYPDVDGVDLAMSVEEAQRQVESEDKDEYSFKLNITKADKTISDLGLEAFPYLISEFTTKYDASNVNRSINLRIAAEKINGTVLMPGEEFSYNKVVGKRTVEEGYKDAKIYADGGVVDGLAGGICQISSTLYNAVLLANLEVTERYNHTYTTSYLPGGRDATVVWGSKDFKFVNTRSYPIKIEASVKSGIAEFKFHGIAEETEYEIKIIPVVTGSIPFSTVYEDDPSLPFGVERVKQGGHSGCRVTTYKEVRLNGNTISKDVITTDTYNPMKKIIIRGVGGAPEG